MTPARQTGFTLSLRSDLHLLRKVWHIGTGLCVLFFHYFFELPVKVAAGFLICLGLFTLLIDFTRFRLEVFNQIVLKVMGPLMRESEKSSYSGMPFYALGVGLTLFLFPERIAILAILFLIFADPIASTIGIIYGREKLIEGKSLQGSLACLVTCYFLSIGYGMYFGVPGSVLLGFSLLAAMVGCSSELLSRWMDDNLSIPLFSAMGISILNFAFQIY